MGSKQGASVMSEKWNTRRLAMIGAVAGVIFGLWRARSGLLFSGLDWWVYTSEGVSWAVVVAVVVAIISWLRNLIVR